jgi:hypothetical protein
MTISARRTVLACGPLAGSGTLYCQVELIESLIEAKVHGIVVGGSRGEYYAQTPNERAELATYAKQVIANRLPLVIGTGATRTEDSVQYARVAKEIGADGRYASRKRIATKATAKFSNAYRALCGRSARQLQSVPKPHQIGQRFRLHFAHDHASAHFDGDFADIEFAGDLLVEKPLND